MRGFFQRSLKYKQIAITRKGVLFFAGSTGDKMRSKGFKRQKVRLRPVIKGLFVPVSWKRSLR